MYANRDPQLQEIIQYIINDDQRAAEVIRRLRALLKKTKPIIEPLDINNLLSEVISEKIIAKGAKKESKSRYNFYRMFFDKVIVEKSIIYSIPTRVGTNKLNIKFYAYNNWEDHYKGFKEDLDRLWVGLRGKASTNKPPDGWGGALGISV
jgi:hypothetical protein